MSQFEFWAKKTKVCSIVQGRLNKMAQFLKVSISPIIKPGSPSSLVSNEICGYHLSSAQWASLGVEMDESPGGHFLDILCCKKMFLRQI